MFASDMAKYPLNLWRETFIGHAVSFVESDNLYVTHINFVGFHEVDEAKWCCNNDVHTFFERINLIVTRCTAVHRQDDSIAFFTNRLQNFSNLQCQFTSRHKHQTTRRTHTGKLFGSRQHGNSERKRLARACSGATTHIDSAHSDGDGFGLNCKGSGEACGSKTGIYFGRNTQGGKASWGLYSF